MNHKLLYVAQYVAQVEQFVGAISDSSAGEYSMLQTDIGALCMQEISQSRLDDVKVGIIKRSLQTTINGHCKPLGRRFESLSGSLSATSRFSRSIG